MTFHLILDKLEGHNTDDKFCALSNHKQPVVRHSTLLIKLLWTVRVNNRTVSWV